MGLTEIDAVSVKLSIIIFQTDVQPKKDKKYKTASKKKRKKMIGGRRTKKREREKKISEKFQTESL